MQSASSWARVDAVPECRRRLFISPVADRTAIGHGSQVSGLLDGAVAAGPTRKHAIVVLILATLAGAGLYLFSRSHPLSSLVPEVTRASKLPQPPPPWTPTQIQDLLSVIASTEAEGLTPVDYNRGALGQRMAHRQFGPSLDALAEKALASLAHDFAAGRVRNRHRFNWYIDYQGPDPAQLAAQATAARERGDLRSWIAGLLPTDPAYKALRHALANTRDEGRRDRIKANLERWRWLPRDFGGGDQLYINLPTYQVDLIRAGERIDSYKAVIGATDMPTPVLSAPVQRLIANPDWIVPASIVRKSNLRPGSSSRYTFSTRPDGTLRVRQKPGPGNALGRLKIEFPNKLAIYFHDTPSRSLFGASDRTFSHGCVRVQNIEELAGQVVSNPERLSKALAGTNTRSLSARPNLQANIVYLTLVPDGTGGLSDVGDPYFLDEKLAAALAGRKPKPKPATLSRKTEQAAPSKPREVQSAASHEPPASENVSPPAAPEASPAPTLKGQEVSPPQEMDSADGPTEPDA